MKTVTRLLNDHRRLHSEVTLLHERLRLFKSLKSVNNEVVGKLNEELTKKLKELDELNDSLS